MMNAHELLPTEITIIDDLLSQALALQKAVNQDDLIKEITTLGDFLPDRVLQILRRFRFEEYPRSALLFSGFPVYDEKIGPTPAHWGASIKAPKKTKEEIFLLLCGAVLGSPICWATQQGGKLVHDILPIKEHAHLQTGASSETTLEWHTEDAFHELRPDFVGLLCLRNPDNTATTIGTFDPAWLSEREIELLFEPQFQIRPDDSHLIKPEQAHISEHIDRTLLAESYRIMAARDQQPINVPVLSGARANPSLCIDPAFMQCADNSNNDNIGDYSCALEHAIRAIDAHTEELALQPGSVVFINNSKAVHGRKPFNSRYDGTDRWLKRVSLSIDFSKSEQVRNGHSRHVIY